MCDSSCSFFFLFFLNICFYGLDLPLLGEIRSLWLLSEGVRRVNYYVKHLVQDLEGKPSETLSWLSDYGDPSIISHWK